MRLAIALLVFCSWSAQLVFMLATPFSSEQVVAQIKSVASNSKDDAGQVNREKDGAAAADLDNKRTFIFIVILLGLAASLMTFADQRWWRLAVIATSFAYLSIWIFSGSLSAMAPWTAMQLKWMAASTLGHEMSFFFKDVILPIVYAGVILWLIGSGTD